MSLKEKRVGLREFQENLTRKIAEVSDTPQHALLGFTAGADLWLMDLADAGEILPLPPLYTVPLAAPWFRGLANVRGTLFGVTDLAALHGHPPIVPNAETRLLLVGARKGANCAIMVSRIAGMRSHQDFAAEAAHTPARQPWIRETYQDPTQQRWLMLGVDELLAAPAFLNAGAEFSLPNTRT